MKKILPTLYMNTQRVSKKTGDAPLFFKHQIKGRSVNFQTKIKVAPEKWDQDLQRVKEDETLSNTILSIRETWHTVLKMGLEDNHSKDQLIKAFQQSINRVKPKANSIEKIINHTYYDLFDKYVQINKVQMDWDYLRKYKTIKNSLQKYYPELCYSDLKFEMLKEYHDHLIDRELSNYTIKDHFKCMKVAAEYGRSLGYPISLDINRYSIKTYRPEAKFLTMEELNALELVQTKTKKEKHVKDWFLFRCFTGLRYSDLEHVNIINLRGNDLQFHIQKQGKLHTIPLGAKSLSILKEYKTFPYYPGQYENITIKKLCERANISTLTETHKMTGVKLISTVRPKHEIISGHDARRSFARLNYERGIKLLTLSKFLGHKSEKTTADYIGITQEDFQGISM